MANQYDWENLNPPVKLLLCAVVGFIIVIMAAGAIVLVRGALGL